MSEMAPGVIVGTFLMLQALDIALTVKILRRGGVELNPLLPSSPGAHVVVKTLLVGGFVAAAGSVTLTLATVLTAWIVWWNVRQLRSMA